MNQSGPRTESGDWSLSPATTRAGVVIDAAAAAFLAAGVDVPVRDIAARAGVGVGTIYRHFPTRADLVVAVYRHQVEAAAEAGPTLRNRSSWPKDAAGRQRFLLVADGPRRVHPLAWCPGSGAGRHPHLGPVIGGRAGVPAGAVQAPPDGDRDGCHDHAEGDRDG